ncbi:hypothetical protein BH11MYX1_BH11MYX1_15380 [soil metagenome]
MPHHLTLLARAAPFARPHLLVVALAACGGGDGSPIGHPDGHVTPADGASDGHVNPTHPRFLVVDSPTTFNLQAIGGLGQDDIWAVSDYTSLAYGQIVHKAASWTGAGNSGGFDGLFGVWVGAANNAWAIGGDAFGNSGLRTRSHWNGQAWSREEVSGAGIYTDVHGTAVDDVWLVSSGGTIDHYDGTAWVSARTGSAHWAAVYGLTRNVAWALDSTGTLAVWNGHAWVDGPSAPFGGAPYSDIWASSASDLFAVGNGSIVHFDGASWTTMASGANVPLSDVWGSGPGDVWAVGYDGTILHYDGNAWNAAQVTTSAFLRGVWGSGPHDVWAVGDGGVIVHFDGTEI